MFIPVAQPWIDNDEIESALQVVKSGWIAKGEQLELFEKKVANYLGVKEAIAVSSGTAALEVALRAMNLKGKEVVTSVASCVATANAILHAGYKPVFVDIDSVTYNISPQQIEKHTSSRTGAIMPVHLYGHACDMEFIKGISEKYNIPIIEDCGQSLGAEYKGRLTGTFGKAGCFSLYANKIITCGEGGIIATDDEELAWRARLIRNQGQHPSKPFYHVIFGYNFKMTNIQAAIGLAQMNKIKRAIELRRRNAMYLVNLLRDTKGIRLPAEMPGAKHVYFCFPIVLEGKDFDRDEVCDFLNKNGIETRPMFRPTTKQPYFVELFGEYPEKFPVAEYIGDRGFYVSCSPTLKENDLDFMASMIKRALHYLQNHR